MRARLILILAAVVTAFAQDSSAPVSPARESTDVIIERLRNNLSDSPVVFELAKRSEDPRVIPALRGLFQEAKLSHAVGVVGIRTSQAIAISLINLGVKDQMYFDELASYARRAIADDPPDPYSVYHVEGNARPEQTPEFDRWCANHGYALDNCAGMWTTSS